MDKYYVNVSKCIFPWQCFLQDGWAVSAAVWEALPDVALLHKQDGARASGAAASERFSADLGLWQRSLCCLVSRLLGHVKSVLIHLSTGKEKNRKSLDTWEGRLVLPWSPPKLCTCALGLAPGAGLCTKSPGDICLKKEKAYYGIYLLGETWLQYLMQIEAKRNIPVCCRSRMVCRCCQRMVKGLLSSLHALPVSAGKWLLSYPEWDRANIHSGLSVRQHDNQVAEPGL